MEGAGWQFEEGRKDGRTDVLGNTINRFNPLYLWSIHITLWEVLVGERHSSLMVLPNSPRGNSPHSGLEETGPAVPVELHVILQYIRHHQLIGKMTYQHYSGCILTGIQTERSIYIFWKEVTCSRFVFKWFLVQEMNLLTSVISKVTFIFAVFFFSPLPDAIHICWGLWALH